MRFRLLLLFSLISTSLFSQSTKEAFTYLEENYEKQETYITMRDGVRLFTAIYSPTDQSKEYPMLMMRTPYSLNPYGEDKFPGRFAQYMHLVEEGYIFVMQDVRGKFMSEGTFVNVRPYIPGKKGKQVDEASDTYDTIDWLVKKVENNNGKVGIFGISYPGFYAAMALPDAHPALKAVSPQAPVTDWFVGDDFHHNGAFFIMDAFSFFSGFGRPRPKPTTQWSGRFKWPVEDNYQFFLDLGPVKNVKERYLGDSIAFWNDLMAHPNYDEFWQARNPRPHLKAEGAAVLTVGGWFDAEDCFGPQAVYEAIENQSAPEASNRIIMGPWSHGQWARGTGENLGNVHWGGNTTDFYKKDVELAFFNYYLKGKGKMELAEATVFDTGEHEWLFFDQWPPEEAELKKLFFQAAGGLGWSASSEKESYDEYVADPMKPVPYTEDVHLRRTREYMTDDQRFAARRPDVMVYQSEVLTEPVTLTGPIVANLFVSTTGTDADYVVKLIDLFPDQMEDYPENEKNVPMGGYQMLVRGEILRGRFRHSLEEPEPFIPGEVTEVRFELPGVAHTFKPGHRIMVQVQNSWFPLVDRNPQTYVDIYHCDESAFQKATHRIYHDLKRPSHLEVLILNK
jgi:putative CocE/NonD family hydrolase